MAYTTAQLTALETAIASGALSVRQSDGTTVTYQSLADMRKLLTSMRAELQVQIPSIKNRAVITPATGKGV